MALTEEISNVRAACRTMGIHHSIYYRWQKKVERYGLEFLRPRKRPGWSRPRGSKLAGTSTRKLSFDGYP